ncbi:hypothetical protein BSY19_4719 (plasmid) [Bosea sp. RAC05]|nr:hypothetical protein BSY19_4719 [Bosea sp. RAC05]
MIDLPPLIEAVLQGADTADAAMCRLLFHGTCEEFDLPPTGGGYDGMVWTAESPFIAQTYIPVAGLEAYVSAPDGWRLADGIRPGRGSFWMDFAVDKLGLAYEDVDWDPHGDARSWSFKKGCRVTYGEAFEALRAMGYVFTNDLAAVRQQTIAGKVVTMPADWSIPGRLLICVRDPAWKLLDISTGESDLTQLQYHDVDRFRDAESAGYDGVIIDDFAQSSVIGNIGHRSIGLFPATAARLEWAQIAATSTAASTDYRRSSTDEFDSLHAGISMRPAPAL